MLVVQKGFGIFVIHLVGGYNILDAFMTDGYDEERFIFLKKWYNELHNKHNAIEFAFEKYLASFMDSPSAFYAIRRLNRDDPSQERFWMF